MSSSPTFFGTPNTARARLGTNDASRTAPANVTTLVTAAAGGTKVEEIVVMGAGTTVADNVLLWIYDGANYRNYDEVLVTAVTPSTSLAAFRRRLTYDNLVLKSGESLRASHTTAGNNSLLDVAVEAFDA
jgi:hypothetical protein